MGSILGQCSSHIDYRLKKVYLIVISSREEHILRDIVLHEYINKNN